MSTFIKWPPFSWVRTRSDKGWILSENFLQERKTVSDWKSERFLLSFRPSSVFVFVSVSRIRKGKSWDDDDYDTKKWMKKTCFFLADSTTSFFLHPHHLPYPIHSHSLFFTPTHLPALPTFATHLPPLLSLSLFNSSFFFFFFPSILEWNVKKLTRHSSFSLIPIHVSWAQLHHHYNIVFYHWFFTIEEEEKEEGRRVKKKKGSNPRELHSTSIVKVSMFQE